MRYLYAIICLFVIGHACAQNDSEFALGHSSSDLRLLLDRAKLAELEKAAHDVYRAEVLVGVDELGRLAIATDQRPSDGRADRCFLITAGGPLIGPWTKFLVDARVTTTPGRIKIEAKDRSFGLNASLTSFRELPFNADRYDEASRCAIRQSRFI